MKTMRRRSGPVLALVFFAAVVAGWGAPALGAGKPPAAGERLVVYNQSSHKYHCPTCEWARKCDKHCVTVAVAEAKKQGGVPCKVCGGECAAGPAKTPAHPRAPTPAPTATPKEED